VRGSQREGGVRGAEGGTRHAAGTWFTLSLSSADLSEPRRRSPSSAVGSLPLRMGG